MYFSYRSYNLLLLIQCFSTTYSKQWTKCWSNYYIRHLLQNQNLRFSFFLKNCAISAYMVCWIVLLKLPGASQNRSQNTQENPYEEFIKKKDMCIKAWESCRESMEWTCPAFKSYLVYAHSALLSWVMHRWSDHVEFVT